MSLLCHAGAFAGEADLGAAAKAVNHARVQKADAQAPSLAQVAQNVKYMWQNFV